MVLTYIVITPLVLHYGRLAQLDRALRYGRKGQGFESLIVHQNQPLVKLTADFVYKIKEGVRQTPSFLILSFQI